VAGKGVLDEGEGDDEGARRERDERTRRVKEGLNSGKGGSSDIEVKIWTREKLYSYKLTLQRNKRRHTLTRPQVKRTITHPKRRSHTPPSTHQRINQPK